MSDTMNNKRESTAADLVQYSVTLVTRGLLLVVSLCVSISFVTIAVGLLEKKSPGSRAGQIGLLDFRGAFFGHPECKTFACHRDVNNAPRAKSKSSADHIAYLGSFRELDDCEAACITHKGRGGQICNSFVWHETGNKGNPKAQSALQGQCFAVLNDSWDAVRQVGVVSGHQSPTKDLLEAIEDVVGAFYDRHLSSWAIWLGIEDIGKKRCLVVTDLGLVLSSFIAGCLFRPLLSSLLPATKKDTKDTQ